jgi:hypothetical protein
MMSAASAAIVAVLGTVGLSIACNSDDATAPPPVTFVANMSAANERPAPNSPATGVATFILRGNDSLDFTITATNLVAGVIASHIHVGDASVASGNIVNPFVVNTGITTGTVASGTIVLSNIVAVAPQISGDSLRVLLNNGMAYVNVHTSTNKGGEIRGQIVKQ